MKRSEIIILFAIVFTAFSCASVNYKTRDGFDLKLNSTNYTQLKGDFSGMSADKILPYNFQKDDPSQGNKNYKVSIDPIDQRHLSLTLYKTDTIIKNVIVKGKYENGYFRLKRKWNASFVIGPLLWLLGSEVKHIGLTKENDLVVVHSGGGGAMLIIILPIFGTGGGQHDIEYTRVK